MTLTKHVRVWVPGTQPVGLPSDLHLTLQPPPLLPFGPGPIEEAATLAVQGHGPGPDPIGPEATMELTFGSTSVLAGSGLKFADGDQVARVTTGTSGPVVEVFAAPIPGKRGIGAGELRLRLTMDQAAAMPEFKKLSGLAPGSATVLRSGGILGPISLGYWEDADITIPVLLLSDGGERKILILSQAGSPLTTGDYTLHTILDRDRWQASSVADAEQHYHDEVAIHLTW